MTGTTRSSADLDQRRRKILFRAWHRGMREMDLILGQFVDTYIAELSEQDLDVFELLIDEADRDILSWLTGEHPIPAQFDTALFRRIKDFHTHLAPIHV